MMDCNITTNFLKEWYRMCKATSCCRCGLHGKEGVCRFYAQSKPEEVIKIVQEWSNEHPIKTRKSVFLEAFPECNKQISGRPTVCVGLIYGVSGCIYDSDGYKDCNKCWNTPIE